MEAKNDLSKKDKKAAEFSNSCCHRLQQAKWVSIFFPFFFSLKERVDLSKKGNTALGQIEKFFLLSLSFCFLLNVCFFSFFCNIFDHAWKEILFFKHAFEVWKCCCFLLSQLVLLWKNKAKRKGFVLFACFSLWQQLFKISASFFFFLKEIFLFFQSYFFVGFILSNFVDSANFF